MEAFMGYYLFFEAWLPRGYGIVHRHRPCRKRAPG
jgi:hypothetical protein